jgi:hypothetical protein
MGTFSIEQGHTRPRFDHDPVAWFAWAHERIGTNDVDPILAQEPANYDGPHGDRWRLLHTVGGVEIRPALVNPFLRENHTPLISAILIDWRIVVELCSVEGRWIGEFEIDELDLAELGRAMIDQRRLPHDNLRFLFGRAPEAAPRRAAPRAVPR